MSADAIEIGLVEQTAARLMEFDGDADGGALFAEVLGVLDAAAADKPPRAPAAIVAPSALRADEPVSRVVAHAPQRFALTIAVVHIVAAPNDRQGSRARDRLSEALTRSRRALSGWGPPGQREVLALRRGRLLDVAGGRVSWADEYEIAQWTVSGGVAETTKGS